MIGLSPKLPRGFRGLRWEPSDEQDVVLLFGRLLDHLERPLAIETVRTGFPDCKATDTETGETLCIEFELRSSHFFRDHERRREKCDWIVCWTDDMDTKPEPCPRIVPLDQIVDAVAPGLVLNRSSSATSSQDAFKRRASGLPERERRILDRLLTFGNEAGVRTEWPETNQRCFVVRGSVSGRDVEYFKVSASGRLGVPFSRWKGVPEAVKSEIAGRLNRAIRSESFSGRGKTDQYLSELFPTSASVEQFISEWRRLTTHQPRTSARRRDGELKSKR